MTTHRCKRAIICAFTVLAFASTSRAQESAPYVGGTFIVSQWKSGSASGGSASTAYTNTEIETWHRNVTVEAGWPITARWSVGVEFTPQSPEVPFTQRYGYLLSQPYMANIRYRETMLFGVTRLNFPEVPYVQLAVVGGAGRVIGHAAGRTAVALRPPFGVGYGPFGEEWEGTAGSFGVIAGGDIGFPVHRHLEIVTQGRLMFIDRGAPVDSGAFRSYGLSGIVPRGGVGARVKF